MAGERILYIDDDQFNRLLVSRVLRSQGYEMHEAGSGEDGLEKAQQLKPDLILMDINLPDVDGYTCTARIREMPDIADTPVIALTANAMVGDREKALAAGCDGYISKPVDVDELPRQVSSYLNGGTPVAASTDDDDDATPKADSDETPSPKKKFSALNKRSSVLGRAKARKSNEQDN